jgi:hypothetical protein
LLLAALLRSQRAPGDLLHSLGENCWMMLDDLWMFISKQMIVILSY